MHLKHLTYKRCSVSLRMLRDTEIVRKVKKIKELRQRRFVTEIVESALGESLDTGFNFCLWV